MQKFDEVPPFVRYGPGAGARPPEGFLWWSGLLPVPPAPGSRVLMNFNGWGPGVGGCEMSEGKASIGDVHVCPAGTGNPYLYRGEFSIGNRRAEALRGFREGRPLPGLVLWHAPCCGGARVIGPDLVDWAGLRP